ncbi:hypothetical protein [Phormidium nigroviride]
MKMSISPIFTKFCKSLAESDKNLFLEQIKTFFNNIEERSSEVQTLEERLRGSSIFGDIKLYGFSVKRDKCSEHWYVSFYDTAIPYAEIEMSSRIPHPEHIMSIDMDYTQLLIEQSLADLAWGYDYTQKTFIELLIGVSPRSCYVGKIIWVYLMLKIRYLPELSQQFYKNVYPKVPIYDFGNYLEKQAQISLEKVIKIQPHKTEDVAQFINKTDRLILNALGKNHMREWLNRIEIDFDIWFECS